jgi:hypothetical protein
MDNNLYLDLCVNESLCFAPYEIAFYSGIDVLFWFSKYLHRLFTKPDQFIAIRLPVFMVCQHKSEGAREKDGKVELATDGVPSESAGSGCSSSIGNSRASELRGISADSGDSSNGGATTDMANVIIYPNIAARDSEGRPVDVQAEISAVISRSGHLGQRGAPCVQALEVGDDA